MPSPTTGVTTLSAAGVSPVLMLDPTARATTVLMAMGGVTSTSTQGVTANVIIQGTLDTYVAGGVTPVWQNISSMSYNIGGGNSTAASANLDGAFISMLGPIAGLRLSSTTWNTAIVKGTLSLAVLQSLTAGP